MLDGQMNEKPEFLKKEPVLYKVNSEIRKEKSENLSEQIGAEKAEAYEKFAEVIDFVNERYEAPGSTIAQATEQLNAFKDHNKQILDKCIEQGVRREMSPEDLSKLEMAAILHDLNKSDVPPEWAEGVDNFMVVFHGEAAAQELETSDDLQRILKDKFGEEGFDDNIAHLQAAIRSHMGPHPGFMSDLLNRVNSQLEIEGIAPIEHPCPEEGDQVSEVLLAADMYSLASSKGVRKVLAIRGSVPFFKQQDEDLSTEYAKFGIELNSGEAALLSAFDSAYAARDMIQNEEDKEWIQGAINKAVEDRYRYSPPKETESRLTGEAWDGVDRRSSGVLVSIEEAQQKRKQFESLKRAQGALQKIQEIG